MKRKYKLSMTIGSIFVVGVIAVLAVNLNPAAPTLNISGPKIIAEGPWEFEGTVLTQPKFSPYILEDTWDYFEVRFNCTSPQHPPSGFLVQLRVAVWEDGWDFDLQASDFLFQIGCTGDFQSFDASGADIPAYTFGSTTPADLQTTLLNGDPASKDYLELIDSPTYPISWTLAPETAIDYKVWFKLTQSGYTRLTGLTGWATDGDLSINAVLLHA
jgi:hypothetical protein